MSRPGRVPYGKNRVFSTSSTAKTEHTIQSYTYQECENSSRSSLNHTPLRHLQKRKRSSASFILSTSSRTWFYQFGNTILFDLLTREWPGASRGAAPGRLKGQGAWERGSDLPAPTVRSTVSGPVRKSGANPGTVAWAGHVACVLHMSGHVACRLDGYSFGHVTGRYNRCKLVGC